MFIRLILTIALSFFVIYAINFFDIASLEYDIRTVAATVVAIIVLRLLYSVFTRFMKVFLFVVIFLPIVGLIIYYIYSYVTGSPVELFDIGSLVERAQSF
ncbi:hypothetical protein [Salinicoccus carnicancri]|uniref:hypothetical protein n=1 Tax=Salinicoccus carnicancri TaxID=558170 RepID=UPI000307E3BB|nr:hypothetical protein [Salinicoccus carnicancri]